MSSLSSVAALTDEQLQQFIDSGFVRIDKAFSADLAEQARFIFWQDLRAQGCLPDDRSTWSRPVIRLGMYAQQSVVAAANTSRLHSAFDQLVGAGAWLPCTSVGTVPVRFPSSEDPGDIGWHVDMSFDFERPDFMDWRINIRSRGRALLMLFLFSDTGGDDAPVRIRTGSHRHIARALAPAGEAGLTLRELLPHIAGTAGRPEVTATGSAGTVYLCHPFLVHSAQMHRGSAPRFLAQPPLLPRAASWMQKPDCAAVPVADASARALEVSA